MKKSKILKLLVSALSLCLIIGAMVGITAMAETGDTKAPEIFSYNVSYSDQLYLYYAVKADLKEGQDIYLQICDADGNALTDEEVGGYDFANPDKEYSAKITKYDPQTVHGNKCYVFATNGVSAKDINKYEYVKAIIIDSEGNAVEGGESEPVEYSVLSYLYQRLYKDGFAGATEGDDAARKDLYESLVAYGAAAQELLLADELEAGSVDSIRDSKYYYIEGNSYIHYEDFDIVRPYHNAELTPDEKVFYGFKVYAYAADGSVVSDGTVVYAEGAKAATVNAKGIYAQPVFEDASYEGDIPTYVEDEGVIEFTTMPSTDHVKFEGSVIHDSIVTTVNGENYLSLKKESATFDAGWLYPTYTEDNANKVEFSFDISMSTTDYHQFELQFYDKDSSKVLYWFNVSVIGDRLYIRSYYGGDVSNYYSFFLGDNSEYVGVDEWFNLKFVIENGSYDYGKVGNHIDVYSNEILVASMGSSYTSCDPADISSMKFNMNGGTLGEIKIDDFAFKKLHAESEEVVAGDSTVTFDNALIKGPQLEITHDPAYQKYVDFVDSYTDKNGVTKYNVLKMSTIAGNGSMGVKIQNTDSTAINPNKVIVEFDALGVVDRSYMEMWGIGSNTVYFGIASSTALTATNTWIHVKLVIVDSDEPGKISTTMYLNGRETAADTRKSNNSVAAFKGISLNLSNASNGDYYFDNISITRLYDPSIDTTELPEKAGIDFDDGVIPEAVTGTSEGLVTHTVVDAGNGNKALRVTKAQAGYDMAGLKVAISETEENANAFLFECDMWVSKFNEMAIYFSGQYTGVCSASSDIIKYHDATAASGKWVHFKLLYTKVDGVDQMTISIGDTSFTYTDKASIDLSAVDYILFAVQTRTLHDTLYDNIVCKKIYVAPVVE